MSWYVAASLEQLLGEINASAPGRSKVSDGSIGDPAHSSRESDHNPCDCHDAVCARDFTHDPAGGFDSYAFADWLRTRCDNGHEDRVSYIISNRRIASPQQDWTWRPYTGSNPHDHHVHVSVDHPSSLFDNPRAWLWEGDDVALTDDDVHRIATAVWGLLVLDDRTDQSIQAQQLLRRIRTDTYNVATTVWNFQIMNDPEGQHQPAQRMIRYIRQDTNALRSELGAGDE